METLLEVKNLSKSYGKKPVFKELFFQLQAGQVYGILGPNGAGKTTLIKCLLGLLTYKQGQIFFQGKLLHSAVARTFGYLPENFLPPSELTALQFLNYLALALGILPQKVESVLNQLDLDPGKKIKKYSRGMIQRLGLAQVLIKDPGFIVLDEPTLGLDPQAQVQILDLLVELNKQGKTILFSSHNLFHIEKICKQISILGPASLKYTGSVDGLLKKQGTSSLEEAYLKELKN